MKIVFYIFLLLAVSCSKPGKLNEEELQKYILDEKNGLTQVQQPGQIKYQVVYRPTDLLVMQEAEKKEDLPELAKKYNSYYYFLLNISIKDKEALTQLGDYSRYSEMIQTLSFRMGDFVEMISSEHDTIPLGDFIFQSTYGMSAANSVMLVFNKQEISGETDWVEIKVNEFGLGDGTLRFRFRKEDLDEAPGLEFEEFNK